MCVQDLIVSVLAKKNAVGKQEVAKLVDDIYRKMQVSGATELASKGQGASDSSNVRPKEEIEDSFQMDKIRCLCGSSLQTDSMIKCEDPSCHVWQHMGCVIIPEKPMEGVLPSPPEFFYCERCRLTRADPFWVTMGDPLWPVKLITTSVPTDGTNPVQSIEKTFQLTRADKDLLAKQEYDVQAWCMLLNDKVLFRMQWPQYADLQVNGVPVRAINRPGSQLLGTNGRDDGPIITPCTRDGINKISLTGCDSRMFCLGVRIVKRRTVQQRIVLGRMVRLLVCGPRVTATKQGNTGSVKLTPLKSSSGGRLVNWDCNFISPNSYLGLDCFASVMVLEIILDILSLIPKESDGEQFEDALARVRRCVGGGTATENADSDSDLEIVADSIPVNLRCPWQCPICLKNYSLENIIIDPYFNRIASKMQNCGEDVTEIEVKPDGSWRAKVESYLGDLGLWHFPDGSLCTPIDEVKPRSEAFKHIKQEGVSEGHASLKLGIKRNRNGLWEVSKPEEMHPLSSGNRFEKFENHIQNVIPMSSSATGSGRDGEDPSVNQDGGGNFDFSANNGIELDSFSLNIDQTYGFTNQNSAPVGDAEVIVLSDSEEENDIMISSGAAYNNDRTDAGEVTFPLPPHGIPDSYPEDPALGTGGSSCLGLFNANDDEYGMNLWPLPPGTQAGPSFQLFGSDADVSVALVDLQHGSLNCPTSMNGYTLTPETAMGSDALVPKPSVDCSNADINDGLVDNPLAFRGDDPSLQIFLPTRPSDASIQANLRNQPDASNCIRSEDWISLRLGDGGPSGHVETAAANVLTSQQQFQSKEGTMNSLPDAAFENVISWVLFKEVALASAAGIFRGEAFDWIQTSYPSDQPIKYGIVPPSYNLSALLVVSYLGKQVWKDQIALSHFLGNDVLTSFSDEVFCSSVPPLKEFLSIGLFQVQRW
ncbi:DNA-binding protein with MIZ/SP-RING zinc finger, PHD-finger and SAP domain-containing protein [Actinidia rufa]|uniref:DNA-binding protein with MIZ/SP-RING zinc finger, PHD-finger and SAP domain-containing protein n=1 Tax=Actinidia rufa TaxID=165716 RepID=A0A7J0H4V7_9ERIC|nr:DNA-binding protein with MIZ/SP-RING zinc finger, PHD-finger and SAP domain-containing protein [Actinidia rufa]